MDIVIDLVIDIVILLLSCYEILDLLSATVTEISNGKIWIESKMRAMRAHCEGVRNENKQRKAKKIKAWCGVNKHEIILAKGREGQ